MSHRRRPLAPGLVGALLAVLVACGRDQRDYEQAGRENTIAAYDRFIQEHPDSRWVREARTRIGVLAEEAEYHEVAAHPTLWACQRFVKNHPGGSHLAEIQGKIRDLSAASLKAKAWRELRGWVAEGRTLLEVAFALPPGESIGVSRFELRDGGGPLARCIGLVPPAEFWGGLSGKVDEVRRNGSLPVGALRPAHEVKEGTGSVDILVKDTFFPVGYKNSLIVGEDLSLKRLDRDSFNLSSPTVTFLLLPDGFQVRSERTKESRLSGFKLPLKGSISLLFVVASDKGPTFELVEEGGARRDVVVEATEGAV